MKKIIFILAGFGILLMCGCASRESLQSIENTLQANEGDEFKIIMPPKDNTKKTAVPEYITVIAVGFGSSGKEAEKNAKENAVVEGSYSLISNGEAYLRTEKLPELFPEQYIHLTEIVRTLDKKDISGEVKIEAAVKINKSSLINAINSTNSAVFTIPDPKAAFDQVSKDFEDAEKNKEFLRLSFKEMFSDLFNLSNIKIAEIEYDRSAAKDNQVPVYVYIDFSVDMDTYAKYAERMEKLIVNNMKGKLLYEKRIPAFNQTGNNTGRAYSNDIENYYIKDVKNTDKTYVQHYHSIR